MAQRHLLLHVLCGHLILTRCGRPCLIPSLQIPYFTQLFFTPSVHNNYFTFMIIQEDNKKLPKITKYPQKNVDLHKKVWGFFFHVFFFS